MNAIPRAALRIVPQAVSEAQPVGNTPAAFAFEDQPVRTLNINSEPWFVAKDVCQVLGYADHISAIKQHCRGVAKHHLTDVLGRTQEATIIPERDLYRLVMRSKLPSAERFEEWVVGTVLPAIRKTGSCIGGEERLDPSAPDYMERMQDLLLAAKERKLTEAEAKIEVLQPKAFALIEEASGSMLVRDAAKALKSTQTALYSFLECRSWVTKKTDKNPQRKATAAATKSGYMTTRPQGMRGAISRQPRW
ncbi:BRO family protein [Paracoccus sp. SY]|uniref:BRO family protein n=1 Tax=Paracoccus sp. SY TaxID=1330255 RepID=UPI001304A047|nr:BRO family protein [Paracoccus sp. SY]